MRISINYVQESIRVFQGKNWYIIFESENTEQFHLGFFKVLESVAVEGPITSAKIVKIKILSTFDG